MKKKPEPIGIIFPDISSAFLDDYYAKLMAGIEEVLKKNENAFQLFPLTPGMSPSLDVWTCESNLAGWIVINWYMFEWCKKELDRLRRQMVFINDLDPYLEDFYFVTGNNIKGGEAVLRYLFEKGHRFVGLIAGNKESKDSQMRYQGVLKEAEKRAVTISHIEYGKYSRKGGYEATKKILKSGLPDALFCFNDEMAFGAMEAMRELKLKVPGDISLVGYDNHSYSELISPALTTMDQHIYKMGKNSALMLLGLLEGKNPPSTVKWIKPVLVERESVQNKKNPGKNSGI